MSQFPDNPGPLPVLQLCNKSGAGKANPVFGEGPIVEGDERSGLVNQLQQMLIALGFDLGSTGPNNDGVDGKFGDLTTKAVKSFQKGHKDCNGNQLEVDDRVGPETADALDRGLVGVWYDHFQTPEELLEDEVLHSVTSSLLSEGILIEPGDAKKTRVVIVGEIPDVSVQTLAIRLVEDSTDNPLRNAHYVLEIGDTRFDDSTDDDGLLSQRIPADAKAGRLTLDTCFFDLTIEDDLGSSDTTTGAYARLNSLGYVDGPEFEDIESEQKEESDLETERLRLAMIQFQSDHDLNVVGALDASTSKKLSETYGEA